MAQFLDFIAACPDVGQKLVETQGFPHRFNRFRGSHNAHLRHDLLHIGVSHQ
jgi:hypothetical protein